MVAAFRLDDHMVALFLQRGADPKSFDDDSGWSVIYHAGMGGSDVNNEERMKVFSLLTMAGARR